MFERKNNFAGMAWAFAAGLVTGGALALFLTPVTGRKLQKKVADATEDVVDKVAGKVGEIKGAVRRLAS